MLIRIAKLFFIAGWLLLLDNEVIAQDVTGADLNSAQLLKYNPPSVSSGSVVRHWFDSNIVDDRNIDVWLPNGYSESAKYNVLYMHDGQMLFDGTTTWNGQEWNVDGILGNLIAEGKINNTIIVGIHNNNDKRHAEFFPEKVINSIPEPQKSSLEALFSGSTRADDYLEFLVTELKPFIDNNYSTNSGQESTFVAGSSMAGLISMYAFCEYPNVFSRSACISTHWIGTFENNSQIPDAINCYLNQSLPDPVGRKIYFDHGTIGLDANYGEHQANIDNTLAGKGYTSSTWSTQVFTGDDHNENDWSARFHIPATYILANVTTSISKPGKTVVPLLFPNPTTSMIRLKSGENIVQVYVYNQNGAFVCDKKASNNQIDVSGLKPGVYFLRMLNKNNYHRFVKY